MEPQAGGGGGCEEDDCVDSGAETGGSDYSHMSSTSSELSLEEAQDPFLVSIHVIADPGEAQHLQAAIDQVLAWIHPDLQLFRVSERGVPRRRKRLPKAAQPALAVVLFLQEEYGEERILQLHSRLQRPPWRHHHTERVQGRRLPYLPCSQDFFALAPGTPLWAVRPVHCGKEIVRFTVYCRHENYADLLSFYELVLQRSPSRKKADFCVFPIFSSLDVDIQFSLKRLPGGQAPVPTDAAVLEFRVRDIGELVPLLPNPCSPISEGRWQTEDHDGNNILLQAQRVHKKFPKPSRAPPSSEKNPHSLQSPSTAAPSCTPDGPQLGRGPTGLASTDQHAFARQAGSPPGHPWSFQRSKSLFCLPTGGPCPASLAEPQWCSHPGPPGHRAPDWGHSHPFSIDNLEGVQETDVDTGLRLSSSDLSVVSAYSAPSRFCSSAETSLSSEGRGSHWSERRGPREGLLPAVSTVATEASWVSLPFSTKGSSSSSVTSLASHSASGACLRIGSSPEPPCDASKDKPSGRDSPPAPAAGDSEMEEFYI
ncbi:protein FAM124A [Choloepus didactylus]|uniref:protein FAM124A n=1 Tax=Choloepus didactylus TaxID=27675 RepID=UPI00189D9872|nr:protein FAM124A [Choloepus didactylus]